MKNKDDSQVILEYIKSKIAKLEDIDQSGKDNQIEIFGCLTCELLKDELDDCFINDKFYTHKLERMVNAMIIDAQRKIIQGSSNLAIQTLNRAEYHLSNIDDYRREVEYQSLTT